MNAGVAQLSASRRAYRHLQVAPRCWPGRRRRGRPERPALLLARVRGPGTGGPSRAPHSSPERSRDQIRPRPGSRHQRGSRRRRLVGRRGCRPCVPRFHECGACSNRNFGMIPSPANSESRSRVVARQTSFARLARMSRLRRRRRPPRRTFRAEQVTGSSGPRVARCHETRSSTEMAAASSQRPRASSRRPWDRFGCGGRIAPPADSGATQAARARSGAFGGSRAGSCRGAGRDHAGLEQHDHPAR